MCLTPAAFALFLSLTGLTPEWRNGLIYLNSKTPAVWVVIGGVICHRLGVDT